MKILLVCICLFMTSSALAHRYEEFSLQMTPAQTFVMLSIYQRILKSVEAPPPPTHDARLSLSEAVMRRARLYEQAGRETLKTLLIKTKLGAYLGPAAYATYIEELSALMYQRERELKHAHTHGEEHGDAHETPYQQDTPKARKMKRRVKKLIAQIEREVRSWLTSRAR